MTILSHPIWRRLAEYCAGSESPFRPEWCNSFDNKMRQARKRYDTDAEFYAKTDVYLYQNAGFFLAGYKRPYYGILFQAIGSDHVTILDYGCGAGYDGHLFLDAGLMVNFAEVPSPGATFLRKRLHDSGHAAGIYLLSEAQTIPQHDIVWCIDVLEHLPPDTHREFVLQLEGLGRTVFLTLVDDKKADGTVHYPVDIEGLTAWARERRYTWCRDYHQQPDGSKVRLLVIGERVPQLSEGGL